MTIAEQVTRLKTDLDEVKASGIDDGRKAEYDAFWDTYQQNGNRKTYEGAFYGWSIESFKPKYHIKPNGSTSNSFRSFYAPGIDLGEFLEGIGVDFDTSECKTCSYDFYQAKCKGTPLLDVSNVSNFNNTFTVCTAEIIRLKVSESTPYTNVFNNCTSLVELYITGTIGKSGLNFQWSTMLSKDSITRIINALSTNTSGLSITLSRAAVESAFGSTTADEWTALIATRTNWTITLV